MAIWYSAFKAESTKMYLRLNYALAMLAVGIIYNGQFPADVNDGPTTPVIELETAAGASVPTTEKDPKTIYFGIFIMLFMIYFVWSLAEKVFFNGTRFLAAMCDCHTLIHFILVLTLSPGTGHLINNAVYLLHVIFWHIRWIQMGENDMSSFKLVGAWRPGFKRFRSEEFGNDCMMFYPVNKEEVPQKVMPYRDVQAYIEGTKLSGQSVAGKGTFANRLVSHLVPDGPLDPIFKEGEKRLIPAVFAHGLGVSNEDHFGVCMQLASCGYLVVSPTFYDGTATAARNNADENVPCSALGVKYNNPDGSPSEEGYVNLRERFSERVKHCQALGRQIVGPGFSDDMF